MCIRDRPSGSFVQVSDKDNGAPGTLGNIGKAAEHGAHFVCPVHIGLFAHVRLYGVKDNQPRPVLRDCLFYALVGERCV